MTKAKTKKKLTDKQKKEYIKAYQNKWLQNRRSEWIKANGPCKKCRTWDNLEVDHIDPSKKEVRIATIWSRKKEFREAELAKCQVLCKACHFKKTTKENKEFGHGTPAKYATCNCVVCKQMKKLHKRISKN
jgi:5-methylcytosine-specific restriction endonuclease McrA